MNTRDNMIFVKGEIKTAEIAFCTYNPDTKKWDVRFTNGKKYSYAYGNIVWLNNPTSLDPKAFHISRNGYEFSGITEIYEFGSQMDFYWHICFENGKERDYRRNDLRIRSSCLGEKKSANVFDYIKQIADLCDIKNEQSGEKILANKFKKMSYVGNDVALAKYLAQSQNLWDLGFLT